TGRWRPPRHGRVRTPRRGRGPGRARPGSAALRCGPPASSRVPDLLASLDRVAAIRPHAIAPRPAADDVGAAIGRVEHVATRPPTEEVVAAVALDAIAPRAAAQYVGAAVAEDSVRAHTAPDRGVDEGRKRPEVAPVAAWRPVQARAVAAIAERDVDVGATKIAPRYAGRKHLLAVVVEAVAPSGPLPGGDEAGIAAAAAVGD